MIDTSFLITLFDKTRANHSVAKKFYKEFIKREYHMMLSTIVIAEYQQGDSVLEIMNSGNFITVPYTFTDALETSRVAYNLGSTPKNSGERANAKDDIKIIGQAVSGGVTFLITDDKTTMYRYAEKLRSAGMISVQPIKLADGFDSALFNSGQTLIDFDK